MLELKNIQFKYRKRANQFTINIPNLNFDAGVISAILGKNGSGKTTLLNIIGGHIYPELGRISLFNKDITNELPANRMTSTVFQTIALFPHLSIQENILIAICPNSFKKPNEILKSKVNDILRNFNLIDLAKCKPNQLSIGQQQRVAIARAVATCPKVLLLDEPTSSLDFENISNLKKLLKELTQHDTVPICIVVSHDLQFVLDIADDIKYIEGGRLIFEGTSKSFIASNYYIN